MSLFAATKALKKYFGFEDFRPTQKKAIASVLKGNDTFVLMPTGGGKSLCYQIPALVLEGTTIVVSPLIALMKDQVDTLKAYGVAAEYLNSSQDYQTQNQVIEELTAGNISLLYVSVERLTSLEFSKVLKQIKVALFAIDEAHCISQWGHDFRPEYTQLSYFKHHFPKVPILAVTATADSNTRSDILTQLELKNPQILIDSFDRPNISLTVKPGVAKFDEIISFLETQQNNSGIIYCLTRNQTEEIATKLRQAGYDAASYHAGMSRADRSSAQQSFARDKTKIICATIAFGMGINKLNIRWVIHYNMPKSIEGYYQEIGRAGRDGQPAQAILFYSYSDVEMLKRFVINAKQKGLQLHQLNRIKEFAESVVCRRKVLLNHFGQKYTKKCNNCDVCLNPFKTFNGTTLARQILEKITTSKNMTDDTLITLLPSADVRASSWRFYLSQLKNKGFIEASGTHNQHLQLSEIGTNILQKNKPVRLVQLSHFIEKQS